LLHGLPIAYNLARRYRTFSETIWTNLTNMSKVFIKTYGCQMNVYDSDRMIETLAHHGYEPTTQLEDADMVILNTCHIREKAAEKVYSELGRLRLIKEGRRARGKHTTIAVAGCVAQAEGEEMVRRAPSIDVVVGPQAYHLIGTLAETAAREGKAAINTDFPIEDKFASLSKNPTLKSRAAPSAFLTIQEGCNKFCTFCVVPYTRGAEFSRSVETVEAEARRLVQSGAREITLLGQNVNAYHGEGPNGRSWSLGELLFQLARIDGLDRLRYTTSHPRDVDNSLIAAHRDLEKLMPYLHLPIQSGSNKMLAAMNRRHSAEEYLETIDRFRNVRPDLALSGDFIVGFPGETEEDFVATLDLVKTANYAQAYSFKYSARPGTPAAELNIQVDEESKNERLQRLQALLNAQQEEFNKSMVARKLPVLLDRPGRHVGQLAGRSPYQQSVHVETSPEHLGEIVEVVISSAGGKSLAGTLASIEYEDNLSEKAPANTNILPEGPSH